jgi:S-adenosylmethionine:tRNA ribosyltransferase-isomerase
VRTIDFNYSLPEEFIAQTPIEPRDHSRLLVLDRHRNTVSHQHFYELPGLLEKGDLLVMNDSRVIPARLMGRRVDSAGSVEVLLLRRTAPNMWQCLGKPGKKLFPGERIIFGDKLEADIVGMGDNGLRLIKLSDESLIEIVGNIPLPPYIRTPLNESARYQTVYAGQGDGTVDKNGSVASPTAGLHFTDELMARLAAINVEKAFVTLHIGLDTFRPVRVDDPSAHQIHEEFWELTDVAARAINRAHAEGRRIVAVGTTSVRVIEQAALIAEAKGSEQICASTGWANLFILPGHHFRMVNAMITNFHLPRTTLLMMVSAFVGRERLLEVYQEAILNGYRFYTFGDSMLIT